MENTASLTPSSPNICALEENAAGNVPSPGHDGGEGSRRPTKP